MTQEQINEYKKKAEELTKKVTLSKEAALDFLIKAGFCTKNGKLKKEYR